MKLPSPSLPPPNIIRAAGVCLRAAREPIGGENAATELRNSTLSRLRDIGELVMGPWVVRCASPLPLLQYPLGSSDVYSSAPLFICRWRAQRESLLMERDYKEPRINVSEHGNKLCCVWWRWGWVAVVAYLKLVLLW